MRTLLSAVLLSTLALSASVRADEPARPSSSDKAAPVVAKVWKSRCTLCWTCLSGSRTTRPCGS